jgi:short subunit dehydrogenase-like uncharacterized protein
MPPSAARAMSAGTALTTPVRSAAPLRSLGARAAAKLVKGSTGGPDAEERSRSSVTILAEARSAAGEVLSTVTLHGPDPYEFTADILAWGAITAAGTGLLGSGALGPIGAFGLERLTQGCAAAGLVRA